MSTNPLNTIPVQQFISQVKSADSSNQKNVTMDIQSAKRLAYTLGEVMARLNGDLEELLIKNASGENEVIQVKVDGGGSF